MSQDKTAVKWAIRKNTFEEVGTGGELLYIERGERSAQEKDRARASTKLASHSQDHTSQPFRAARTSPCLD